MFGPFIGLFNSFVRDFADIHYKRPSQYRHEVRAFLTMLTAEGIVDINDATIAHIGRYLAMRPTSKYPTYLKAMFDYLIRVGAYLNPNPVQRRFGISRQLRPSNIHEIPSRTPGVQWDKDPNEVIEVRCAFCRKQIRRSAISAVSLQFCPGHYGKYRQEQNERKCCGPYFELLQDYIHNFAEGHYQELNNPRHEIRHFFETLIADGITDINDTMPIHITNFLALKSKTKHSPRADYVKVMFDYLIELGVYRSFNPVLSRIHYRRQTASKPRPYVYKQCAQLWVWLEERGDTRAKLIVAFGVECGIRGKEVCNIRAEDIDSVGHRIWIRNPTKNRIAGYVPFGEKTERWLRQWLQERPEHCGHDHLLINIFGNPMRVGTLRGLLKGVFCKTSLYRKYKEGLDAFSFHALRHTNTTNMQRCGVEAKSNMTIHRWARFSSFTDYNEVAQEQLNEQFARAMLHTDAKKSGPARVVVSMASYIATRKASTERSKTADEALLARMNIGIVA